MNNDKYLSIPEAAALLGLSRNAVYKRVKKGQIKAIRAGRNYIIYMSDIAIGLHKSLDKNEKRKIERVVKRVCEEYGQTLKMLGEE